MSPARLRGGGVPGVAVGGSAMRLPFAVVGALASGVLLALSLPDAEIWSLAWIGLVPLLLALRDRRPRAAFGVGWLGGLVFYLAVLYWIAPTISGYTQISPALAIAILVLLCAVEATFVGAFAALLEWLAAAGVSRVLAAPVIWVSLDWLRTFFPAAFPWAFIGYSQYAVSPVIQVADLTGIYGVTAVIVALNAALVEFVHDGMGRHRRLVAGSVILLVLVVLYGHLRLAMIDAAEGGADLRVGLVQGDIPQALKWDPALEDDTLSRYLGLSRRATNAGAKLVVWPEASVPFFLSLDPRAAEITHLAGETDTYILVGAPGYERVGNGKPRQYNQAWLARPDQRFSGPYDKIELVPFGEYVPFGGLLGWVHQTVEAVADFGRGTRAVVFDGPAVERADGSKAPVRLGVLICYEGIFPALTRRFVVAGAELLVNISNDAWYGRTSAPYQHLAMASVRAVENRVPLVRATNTGISAVVDVAGRIRGRTPLFEESVSVDDVKLRPMWSLYRAVGDWFVYLCLLGVAALVALRLRQGAVLPRDVARGIVT